MDFARCIAYARAPRSPPWSLGLARVLRHQVHCQLSHMGWSMLFEYTIPRVLLLYHSAHVGLHEHGTYHAIACACSRYGPALALTLRARATSQTPCGVRLTTHLRPLYNATRCVQQSSPRSRCDVPPRTRHFRALAHHRFRADSMPAVYTQQRVPTFVYE